MISILGFLGLSMALWMGAWLAERTRRTVSPLGALAGWLVCIRASGLMAADCYQAASDRLERWPEHVSRVRRES